MRNDQIKIAILLLTVFLAFATWISIEQEKEIAKLEQQQQILTATVDSLRVEYYGKTVQWGLFHASYR
jgi:hypothetical protein